MPPTKPQIYSKHCDQPQSVSTDIKEESVSISLSTEENHNFPFKWQNDFGSCCPYSWWDIIFKEAKCDLTINHKIDLQSHFLEFVIPREKHPWSSNPERTNFWRSGNLPRRDDGRGSLEDRRAVHLLSFESLWILIGNFGVRISISWRETFKLCWWSRCFWPAGQLRGDSVSINAQKAILLTCGYKFESEKMETRIPKRNLNRDFSHVFHSLWLSGCFLFVWKGFGIQKSNRICWFVFIPDWYSNQPWIPCDWTKRRKITQKSRSVSLELEHGEQSVSVSTEIDPSTRSTSPSAEIAPTKPAKRKSVCVWVFFCSQFCVSACDFILRDPSFEAGRSNILSKAERSRQPGSWRKHLGSQRN